jgi:hypothetical protein
MRRHSKLSITQARDGGDKRVECHCKAERYITYPEKEQDSDQDDRIDGLSQRKFSSVGPLVIAVLERILLQPFRSHDCGTQIFNERNNRVMEYGLNMQDLAYLLMLLIKRGSSPAIDAALT